MKNRKKASVILGAIFICLGTIAGCQKKQDGKEVKEGENTVSGKYYNTEDLAKYIELKADGTAFWRYKDNMGQYHETARQWKVYEDEIALIGSLGDVERGQITGNKILADGEVWITFGESRKPTKDNIPGNYILTRSFGETTRGQKEGPIVIFRKDGKLGDYKGDIDPRFSWKIENGLVQIYDNEFGGKQWENGRLEGSTIVFEEIDKYGTISHRLYIKQDGKARPTLRER